MNSFKIMPSNNKKVALIQMSDQKSQQQNLAYFFKQAKIAKKKGAKFVASQELFLSEYFCQHPGQNQKDKALDFKNTPLISQFQKFAKENKLVLILSLCEKINRSKKTYNTAIVIDADGKFLGSYRKLHIPNDRAYFFAEADFFKPGDLGLPVFKTRYGRIGVLVCWDQWFFEPARILAYQNVEIIFYPTSIGFSRGIENQTSGPKELAAWITMHQAHAIANGIYIAAINRVGPEDQIKFWGQTLAVEPGGKILKKANQQKSQTVIFEIDPKKIKEWRKDWPFLKALRQDVLDAPPYLKNKK